MEFCFYAYHHLQDMILPGGSPKSQSSRVHTAIKDLRKQTHPCTVKQDT